MNLVIILIILIVGLNILIWYGLKINFITRIQKFSSLSSISVVIAARNEEDKIEIVLDNLLQQSCIPSEIVFVDDYSSDSTFKKAERKCIESQKLKILRNHFPPGKKNALTAGIKETLSENILLTDADCLPDRQWVASFVNKFSGGYDLLFGIAPFINTGKTIEIISSYENLKGFILSVAALAFNMPYSAAARSLGFKKSSFDKLNGYSNTMEIPFGDDGLLIREAVRHKMKIGFVSDPGSFVYSTPKDNLKDYLTQRKRHTTTSFYYSFRVKTFLMLWHLINLLPFILLIFSPLSKVYFLPLIVKYTADLIIVKSFQQKFGYSFKIFRIIYQQFLYEILLVIHFFNALTGRVKWK